MNLVNLRKSAFKGHIHVLSITNALVNDMPFSQCVYLRLDEEVVDVQDFLPIDGQCPRWKELRAGFDYLIEEDKDGRWMTIEPIDEQRESRRRQELLKNFSYLVAENEDGYWAPIKRIKTPDYSNEELRQLITLYEFYMSCMARWDMRKSLPPECKDSDDMPAKVIEITKKQVEEEIELCERWIEAFPHDMLNSKWMCQKMGEYRTWLIEKYQELETSH